MRAGEDGGSSGSLLARPSIEGRSNHLSRRVITARPRCPAGVDLRRIAAEVGRQLLRESTLRLLTGFVLLVGLMAALTAATGSFQTLTVVPYVFAPTLVCPIAAHRALSDRDTGLAGVHATTPLRRPESLLATLLWGLALTPVAVVVSLPVLYASLMATAPGALLDLAAYPLWAVSIGTTASCVGLLVGHLTPSSPRLGVALAFGVVLAWLFFGLAFAESPNPPLAFAFLRRSSPLSYAIQAVGNGPLPVGSAMLMLFPLSLAAWALALLVPVSLGLQHADGWHRPLRSRPGALVAAIALLVLGAAALLPWSAPTLETSDLDRQAGSYHGSEKLWVNVELDPFGFPDPPWTQGVERHVQLTLVGEPNETVTVEQAILESEILRFEPSDELPQRVVLDHIVRDDERHIDETGGPVGTATVNLTFQAYPQRVFNQASTTLTLTIDDHTETHELDIDADYWHVEPAPLALATAVTAITLIAGLRWMPSRWNRW